MIAGYIRSEYQESIDMQKMMIQAYLDRQGIKEKIVFFEDRKKKKRKKQDKEQLLELGLQETQIGLRGYEQLLQLIVLVATKKVSCILVDTIIRLFDGKCLFQFLRNLCEKKGTKIVEVGKDDSTDNKIAVYYSVKKGISRPIVPEKEIDYIYQEISRQKWREIPCLFLDFSLIKSEQNQREKLYHSCNIGKIFTKNFAALEKKTGTLISEVKRLHKDTIFYSLEEGELQMFSEVRCNQKSKVAVYNQENEDWELERIRIFLKEKANLNHVSIYSDHKDQEINLKKLIEEKDKYSMIFVFSLLDIHYRTSMFFKRLNQLSKPVYGIKEGCGMYVIKNF